MAHKNTLISFNLISMQIYPVINYISLQSALSFIYGQQKSMIEISKMSKIFALIFADTNPFYFILFLFLHGFGE